MRMYSGSTDVRSTEDSRECSQDSAPPTTPPHATAPASTSASEALHSTVRRGREKAVMLLSAGMEFVLERNLISNHTMLHLDFSIELRISLCCAARSLNSLFSCHAMGAEGRRRALGRDAIINFHSDIA